MIIQHEMGITIDLDVYELFDLAFADAPGAVIDWIREHTKEIIQWKQWNEKHLNDFLEELHRIRVGEP